MVLQAGVVIQKTVKVKKKVFDKAIKIISKDVSCLLSKSEKKVIMKVLNATKKFIPEATFMTFSEQLDRQKVKFSKKKHVRIDDDQKRRIVESEPPSEPTKLAKTNVTFKETHLGSIPRDMKSVVVMFDDEI